jgi:hypothetical protein
MEVENCLVSGFSWPFSEKGIKCDVDLLKISKEKADNISR